MAVMLERWNDERMDDLAGKVDGIGVQLREQRSELRGEIDATRGEMKAGFERMDARFERMDERFERLYRGLMNAAIALTSSVIVGFGTLLAAQL